jgi:hypothetical protein
MQITLDLLGDSSTVGWRQAADPFDDQAIVEREQLEPDDTRHGEPGIAQFLNGGVSGPRSVSGGRDHGQNGLSMFVECRRTKR